MHRRVAHLICRAIQWPRIMLYRAVSTNSIDGPLRRFQPVQCIGVGKVSVEKNVSIGVFPSPLYFSTYAYLEARRESASISIGSGTWINNNFCAVADHTAIKIGRNCRIGTNVEIFDSDFHGLRIEERNASRPEWAKPVWIGNDVFIGSNVTILKGVSIGDGTVIANSAVVTKDVPAGVVAGGNPARVLKVIG